MASSSPVLFLVIPTFYLIFITSCCVDAGGFHAELIHRDSPLSPLFDPTKTPSERMNATLHRDVRRGAHIRSRLLYSEQKMGSGRGVMMPEHYASTHALLVKLSVGTPPVDVFATPDTGSATIWIPCKPCLHCGIERGETLFDPANSTTYHTAPCNSASCNMVAEGNRGLCTENNECTFNMSYLDASGSSGVIGMDTFNFDSPDGRGKVAVPGIIFGCAQELSNFHFGNIGVIGMSEWSQSLLSQLLPSINGKFSICIARHDDANPTGRFYLGKAAVSPRGKVARTALMTSREEMDNDLLWVRPVEIRVSGERPIPFLPELSDWDMGMDQLNMVVDTGSTLMVLPRHIFRLLANAVSLKVGFPTAKDPSDGVPLERCYRVKSPSDIARFPDLVMGLPGANVTLKGYNYVYPVTPTIACLTILPDNDKIPPTWGNLAMQNIHIEFDVLKKQISFVRTDCSKL